MSAKPKEEPKRTLRESEKKWGKDAIAAGFTVFPNLLLQKQHALGLDCIDVVLILQILKHWWHAEKAPFPSQVQLAKTMNVDVSTIKRHLVSLRDAGLISWSGRVNVHGGQAANAYDLSGLIKHVASYAAEELKARESQSDARKARARRKKPVGARPVRGTHKLRVVKGEGND